MSQRLQEYAQMVVLLCTLHVLCTVKYFASIHEVYYFPANYWETEGYRPKIENAYMQTIICVDSVWYVIVHIRATQTQAKTQARSRSVLR